MVKEDVQYTENAKENEKRVKINKKIKTTGKEVKS